MAEALIEAVDLNVELAIRNGKQTRAIPGQFMVEQLKAIGSAVSEQAAARAKARQGRLARTLPEAPALR